MFVVADLGRSSHGLARVINDRIEVRVLFVHEGDELLEDREVAEVQAVDVDVAAPAGVVVLELQSHAQVVREARGRNHERTAAEQFDEDAAGAEEKRAGNKCNGQRMDPQVRAF